MGRRSTPSALAALRRLLALLALGSLALLAAPAALRAEESAAQAEARAAYAAGVEAFGAGEYERAHSQFTLAESKFPSPNIELMLGRSLLKLEKLVEAHRMLTLARDNAGQVPKYANAASAARDELAELEKRLASLRVRVGAPQGDETLHVGGELLPPIAWANPIIVPPGKVRIELARPGVPAEVKELSLAAGSSTTLELRLKAPAVASKPAPAPQPVAAPAPKPAAVLATRPAARSEAPALSPARASEPAAHGGGRGRQLRGFSYALAGVGVLGIGTFGVFGAMSHSQFAKLEAGCPEPTRCDPRLRDSATRGQTYQTLANVALVAGAAALTTAVTLWLVSLPEERAEIAITPSSVQLRGSF